MSKNKGKQFLEGDLLGSQHMTEQDEEKLQRSLTNRHIQMIAIGGAIKGLVDNKKKKANIVTSPEEDELGKGSLFATGLVAGGAVAGVIIAFVSGSESGDKFLKAISMEESISSGIGVNLYYLLGVLFFALMGWILYRTALKK